MHRERVEPLELGSTKARLYIDCAQRSDAGQYTCVPVCLAPISKLQLVNYIAAKSAKNR